MCGGIVWIVWGGIQGELSGWGEVGLDGLRPVRRRRGDALDFLAPPFGADGRALDAAGAALLKSDVALTLFKLYNNAVPGTLAGGD